VLRTSARSLQSLARDLLGLLLVKPLKVLLKVLGNNFLTDLLTSELALELLNLSSIPVNLKLHAALCGVLLNIGDDILEHLEVTLAPHERGMPTLIILSVVQLRAASELGLHDIEILLSGKPIISTNVCADGYLNFGEIILWWCFLLVDLHIELLSVVVHHELWVFGVLNDELPVVEESLSGGA
jgi:hypothetical protein